MRASRKPSKPKGHSVYAITIQVSTQDLPGNSHMLASRHTYKQLIRYNKSTSAHKVIVSPAEHTETAILRGLCCVEIVGAFRGIVECVVQMVLRGVLWILTCLFG
jgi:hypothetical protein